MTKVSISFRIRKRLVHQITIRCANTRCDMTFQPDSSFAQALASAKRTASNVLELRPALGMFAE